MSRRNRGNGHHWEWLDAPTYARGKELIPGLLRRMRAMEADLKLIEEQKKEVEDKLKMVEREKKELEYEVGELGKQKIVGREKNRPTTKRESDLGGFISIIGSWVFGDYDDALCLEQLVDIFGWKLRKAYDQLGRNVTDM
ncbi:unnamed protein product [Prunus armeniaca]|uniref:Uncharacterized protein n=1 Tax=Prunus armeniaca TaxID=36596 RepID=A0A6J5TNB6_PRUAR|nr:unnamed protein product [Prunus armeniaca]